MNTKEEILKIVDALFSDKGYNLSMAEIAKGVDIKVASIYSHYAGKDEIILLVVESEIDRFFYYIFSEIEKMDHISCEEKLRKLFFMYVNYFRQWNRLRFWKNMSLIQNEELRKICGDLVRRKEIDLSRIIYNIFEEGKEVKKINCFNLRGMVSFYFVTVKGVMDIMYEYQDSDRNLELFIDEIWSEYWFAIKN